MQAKRMLQFQPCIPRLPVPELNSTINLYLKFVKPLVSPQLFSITQNKAQKFLEKDAKILHEQLINFANQNRNSSYIAEFWRQSYLSTRAPNPININPGLFHYKKKDQIQSAVNTLLNSAKFIQQIKDLTLPPDFSGNQPCDMIQYLHMFSRTRLPRKDMDIGVSYPLSRFIIILYKNNFFRIELFDEYYQVSPNKLFSSLKKIISTNSEGLPIGSLTGQDRDIWAIDYDLLSSNDINKANLEQINSSLLILAIEDENVDSLKSILHNYGRNRWFDKPICLTISKDGSVGVNFEHSWGDGQTVTRFFSEIVEETEKLDLVYDDNILVNQLNWEIDLNLKQKILTKHIEFGNWCDNLEIEEFGFSNYGKNQIKKWKLSPDAFIQMALQIAHWRVHKRVGSTYESASTKHFLRGRTETIRSVSEDSIKLTSDQIDKQLFIKAVETHVQTSKIANLGLACDRHLFGMQCIANLMNIKQIEFYDDETYKIFSKIILSTSNLSSENVDFFAFGPVSDKGYGIGYSIHNDKLNLSITNFKGQSTNGNQFKNEVEKCFIQLKQTFD
eukprot:TRINITY_DN196_c0_g1_i1.p1 TRINITY_DN196_c0_g1~~TRINITY_DN196_c0_g1_i1.p1  ORF type:complete len:559 (-),score=214.95 TRINITY_DN196_c0_g1_i1:68-1744(-)